MKLFIYGLFITFYVVSGLGIVIHLLKIALQREPSKYELYADVEDECYIDMNIYEDKLTGKRYRKEIKEYELP